MESSAGQEEGGATGLPGAQVKEAWERGVVEWFLPVYNWSCGRKFRRLRPGDAAQGEPDVLCVDHDSGAQIWIEITTAYYDNAHGKTVHDSARGRAPTHYWLKQPDAIEDRRLLCAAIKGLREKLRKPRAHYRVSQPIILLVFTKSLRSYLRGDRIRRHVERLRVRGGHPFAEVYLMSESEGCQLRQLYPCRRWIPEE